ncbi:hypothetical protein HGRIS_003175 [Hohenbuehelia grisea]|uniref:Uncharacterized protein n=1 Tax=Hohenbuehelia grisea TaxID=104357 RepID=A0ABR3JMN6_9AGAR
MKAIALLVVLCALLATSLAFPAELPKGKSKGSTSANKAPAAKGSNKGKGKGPAAPVTPVKTLAEKVDEQWASMRTHVLEGDAGGDPSAGRHTITSWQKANGDEGWCHKETHICAFRHYP